MATRKIGALWARKTADGKQYLSGTLNDLAGDIQIVVFKNDRKEKENQPDYSICLSEKRDQQKPEQKKDDFFGGAEFGEAPPGTEIPTSEPAAEEIKVEDIPF